MTPPAKKPRIGSVGAVSIHVDTTSPHHPADAQALADELAADVEAVEQSMLVQIVFAMNCSTIGRNDGRPLHDILAVTVGLTQGITVGLTLAELVRCRDALWPQAAYVSARNAGLTEPQLVQVGRHLPTTLIEEWLIYCAAGITPWAAVRAAGAPWWKAGEWRARAVWQTIVWRTPPTLATVVAS